MENIERSTSLIYTPSWAIWRIFSRFSFLYGLFFIKEIQYRNKEILIRYRNTRGCSGKLEIAWKHTLRAWSCSHFNFPFSQTHSCFYTGYGNTENVFYFLNLIYVINFGKSAISVNHKKYDSVQVDFLPQLSRMKLKYFLLLKRTVN